MKIIMFLENNLNGGLDTFCCNLINNWPDKSDNFILIYNCSHPGHSFLKKSIRKCDHIILHKIPLSWHLSKILFGWLPFGINRLTQPFLRLILVFIQIAGIKEIFKKLNADALIVINGGYPAGETCRLANIVWYNTQKDEAKKRNIHNFHNFSVSPRFGFGWYENFIDKKLLNSKSEMISVSKVCSDSIQNRPIFANYKRVKTIYNGITVYPSSNYGNGPNLRKLLAIDNGSICLLLANYEKRKGHEFLFKSFKEVLKEIPNAHLVCCGDSSGNDKFKISAIRESLNCEANIHLLDFLPNGRNLISQADVLVISSQYQESFGFTAIEAMLERTPVVATKVGGLKEVLGTPAVGGYLVDPKNFREFSKKIIKLLSNQKLCKTIGNQGRKKVKLMFTAREMAEKYHAVLFNNHDIK